MGRLRVAVVGVGHLGKEHARILAGLPEAELVGVADAQGERAQAVAERCGTRAYDQFWPLLNLVDAAVIAVPTTYHLAVAGEFLRRGIPLLVEKPLAASSEQAAALVALAKQKNLVLCVDHTFIYSGPVQLMKKLVDSGELGDLYYIDSVRINLGLFQHDVNVIWDLAPHDLSIMDHLIGKMPRSLSAFGTAVAQLPTRG